MTATDQLKRMLANSQQPVDSELTEIEWIKEFTKQAMVLVAQGADIHALPDYADVVNKKIEKKDLIYSALFSVSNPNP